MSDLLLRSTKTLNELDVMLKQDLFEGNVTGRANNSAKLAWRYTRRRITSLNRSSIRNLSGNLQKIGESMILDVLLDLLYVLMSTPLLIAALISKLDHALNMSA